MSFHFHKLELKDWLAYGGKHTVIFPDFSSGKNIIAIHGRNGFGKTSLLRALQYVFYGEYGREELLDAWHDAAQENGEGTLEVALEFTHKGRLCKIIRVTDFRPWGDSSTAVTPTVQLWMDGEQEEGQIEDKIQQMIPRESQQFVFFDGAEITRYAQKQHEEGVKHAIEQILGIPAVRNLRYDLKKLIEELEREQSEIVGAEEKNLNLLAELDTFENDEQAYLNRLAELEEKRAGIKHVLEELRREATQIQAIEAEHSTLQEKKNRLADLKGMLLDKDKSIAKILSDAPIHIISSALIALTEDYISKQGSPNDPQFLLQTKRVLELILADTLRECGDNLEDCVTNSIKKKLQDVNRVLASSPTSRQGLLSQRDHIDLSALLNEIRKSQQNGNELLDQKAAINESILELETDIRRLREKLEGHALVEVQENYRQQKDLENQYEGITQSCGGVEENLSKVRLTIADKRRELDQLATDTDRGKGITETLQTTRKSYAAVTDLVNELVRRRREEIEQLASNIFMGITNKPLEYAGVYVRDDYTLEVYRRDGSIVDNTQLSAGEKEVLAYSFITALNLSSPDPAPFVMDTPFGHLDSIHRERLLKSLPNLKVQVFLLATDRDLPSEEKSKIQQIIAEEYLIGRDQRHAKSFIEEM